MADTSRPRRRVLFIAYTFPPIGGSGVQRTTKFVKYLPQYGWDCSVLTVDGGSVPVWDKSLERDVPQQTRIVRARTFEPGYDVKAALAGNPSRRSGLLPSVRRRVATIGRSLLQPDPQVLWAPSAAKNGLRLLRSFRHDAIVATAPPFSTLLLGAWLADRSGVRLVLDYRDEWSTSNTHWENRRPNAMIDRLQVVMENWALRRAALVLTTTQASADSLTARIKQAGGRCEAACIYNGYDPEDFRDVSQTSVSGPRLRIVYTGTLWNLTSIRPLVCAIQELTTKEPSLVSRLELVIAGRRTPEQDATISSLANLPCRLELHDYVDHTRALELMTGADALVLLLADGPGASRCVPAKTFEYLALGRPILAIVPRGETAQIVRRHPLSTVVTPSDIGGVVGWLTATLRSHVADVVKHFVPYAGLEFDRRVQAGRLGELITTSQCSAPDVAGRRVIADARVGT